VGTADGDPSRGAAGVRSTTPNGGSYCACQSWWCLSEWRQLWLSDGDTMVVKDGRGGGGGNALLSSLPYSSSAWVVGDDGVDHWLTVATHQHGAG
jgi:hypothetical protein